MTALCATVILGFELIGSPAASTGVPQPDTTTLDAGGACVSAIPIYRASLRQNPNDAAMHNGLGVCYQRTRQLKEAIREYQQALKLNGRYAEAWNNLGSVYHGKRKLKRAVDCYRKAVQLKPEMAVVHKNLGTALLSLGRVEDGLAAYRRAMDLDPSIFETAPPVSFSTQGTDPALQYYYFAKLCASKGRVESALLFLRKARSLGFHDFNRVRRDPDFQSVISLKGFALLAR